MTHSRVQWRGWRCKLCSSGAACDIFTPTEAEMNGFDTFSDDPDICDACIHLNYVKRWRWGTPEQWFALTVGQYLAFFMSLILVLRHSQFHGFWRLVGYWLRMLLLLVVVCVRMDCDASAVLALGAARTE